MDIIFFSVHISLGAYSWVMLLGHTYLHLTRVMLLGHTNLHHTGDVAIFARQGRPGRLAAQPRWSFIDWKFIQPRKHEMSNLNYWTRKRSATA